MLLKIREKAMQLITAVSVFALIFLTLMGFFGQSTIVAEAPKGNENANQIDRSDTLKDALKTDQALPDALFGIRRDKNNQIKSYGCKVDFTGTQGGTNQTEQNKKNKEVMIGCIGSVIRLLFVVSVVITIARIAFAQLGIVAFGGEDSSQGGPVIATRKALTEGLVGIAMVGGAMLILQLFTTSFDGALDALFGAK